MGIWWRHAIALITALVVATGAALVVGPPGRDGVARPPLGGRLLGAVSTRPALLTPGRTTRAAVGRSGSAPLRGRVVVIDPGHQLGNRHFPRETSRQVPAGGFTKPCNTTGTATDAGYAEATFAWRVSLRLRGRLRALGARVVMTRHGNREDRWGPCVDVRGRAGNDVGHGRQADLKISVHGDGSEASGAHGFHVISPTDRAPWTHDIYSSSRRLAVETRAALRRVGFEVATYVAGGDGLDRRADLATLNLSDVPTVMVELGNMRDAGDARRMTSTPGQRAYARALTEAVRRFLPSP